MAKTPKRNRKKIFIAALAAVIVIGFVILIGILYHNVRSHRQNDISSFVISLYSESQTPTSDQSSLTLTLMPTSCSLTVATPNTGNYAPSASCPMNEQIWNNITSAYFNGNLPSQNNSSTPVTGPILLLGVYYKDGTSNTVYFSRQNIEANQSFNNFLQNIKTQIPQSSQL